MILEAATLAIKPGQREAFESAMKEARPLIAASDGFGGIEVRPCIEVPDQYLLLVWWDTLDDHVEGFRGSSRYQAWRALLHEFYDPFPEVLHYGESFLNA